ncbi:nitroreductase/quinone reductase family protein [Gordonia sp. DT30]|uniref:nitroreductase/quinone reductase family protein n=1 Tax=unclassified Gordonia (in: high G+C Gram-positive bacteria) TaxID=2657482 RepID=UPI003CF3B0E1
MTASTPDRASTLKIQGLANRVVRTLLATPGISRGIGSRLVTLYVTGRKSGRHYTIPVAYQRQGDRLLLGTPFGWGKNLRTGEPIEIRLKGKRRTADVEVFTEEPEVVAHYAQMCRDNAQFAKFNKIRVGADGTPDADDLHAAWQAGARTFLLTPR